MIDRLSSWKETVIKLNDEAESIIKQRDVCYQWIANELKKTLNETGFIPNINVSNDGREIQCYWGGDIPLKISPQMFSKIPMEWDFKSEFVDGQFCKIITFYPFGFKGIYPYDEGDDS